MESILLAIVLLIRVTNIVPILGVSGDIAHLFSPDFGFFQTPHQPSSLYAVPPQSQLPPAQQSPVAPVHSTTTEFFLPEVIDNRQAKEHGNFIPLNHYLPPSLVDRPNYESPKPSILPYLSTHGDSTDLQFFGFRDTFSNNAGYQYQVPTPVTSPSPPPATMSTTTQRPSRPIVVLDQPAPLPPNRPLPSVELPNGSGYDYNAPALTPSTPAPIYLPANSGSGFLRAESTNTEAVNGQQIRLQVNEMRCLQNGGGGFFKSILKVDSFLGAVPIVENDSADKRCQLNLSRSYVLVTIAEEDFHKCGVRQCEKDLCLRLRFPSIRGIRTGSDAILTLHCKTQEKIAVKTHAIKMGVANEAQARSLGTYAHGGSQNQFRTHIELLRKSTTGFTRHVDSNSVVQLGEDLMLRAHVIDGDGWNYTKLTDINLQRISPAGELLNSANLITSQGCVNPSMRSVCSRPPSFDPPLGHRLTFRAVMFEGMKSGDTLVMSMRITGCLEQHDCHINTQDCSATANSNRRRRNIGLPGGNSTEYSEISSIAFRVKKPSDIKVEQKNEMFQNSENLSKMSHHGSVVIGGVLAFVALLCALGAIVFFKVRKWQY